MIVTLNRKGVTLADALRKEGHYVNIVCGGFGSCGKCRVRASGELSEPDKGEREILGEKIESGWRLACRAVCNGKVTVELPDIEEKSIESILLGSNASVAVDIGTTTIEACAVGSNGKILKRITEPNLQRAFGADVMTRIGRASETDELHKVLRGQVADIINRLSDSEIETAVITGNTAMLHFFTGKSVSGMAAYPFTPESLFGEYYSGDLLPECSVGRFYLPPCFSAFVGADTATAILYSDIFKEKNTLLADIGTNGEIAYFDGEKLYCASTAAGPALEGAGIDCGMKAADRVIDKVWVADAKEKRVKYSVFGGGEAVGICGSGLISAVSALVKLGVIDKSGYMEENFRLNDEVYISPKDIRNLQLAKSALRSGMDVLSGGNADRLKLAGRFGAALDLKCCIDIGLVAPIERSKVDYLGNAALEGAVMIIEDKSNIEVLEKTVRSAEVVNLDSNEKFCELFVQNMFF